MGKMQRDKGKRGELEVAKLFTSWGIPAARTSQYCGAPRGTQRSSGVGDVVLEVDSSFHVEVKRTETVKLWDWVRQFNGDRVGSHGVIMHRKSECDWVAVVPAETLKELMLAYFRDALPNNEVK